MILSYERQHYKTKCNSEDFGCKNSSVAPLFNIKIKICKTCQTFWIDSFFNLLIYSANSNSYFFLLSSFFLSSSVIFLNMSQMTQMSQTCMGLRTPHLHNAQVGCVHGCEWVFEGGCRWVCVRRILRIPTETMFLTSANYNMHPLILVKVDF